MKNKYYNIKDCIIEYNIQDISDKDINKKYCIVNRNLVVDYVNFRNLLVEYGVIGEKEKPDIQKPVEVK